MISMRFYNWTGKKTQQTWEDIAKRNTWIVSSEGSQRRDSSLNGDLKPFLGSSVLFQSIDQNYAIPSPDLG